eukprot:2051780-Amphidinium_carterae.1
MFQKKNSLERFSAGLLYFLKNAKLSPSFYNNARNGSIVRGRMIVPNLRECKESETNLHKRLPASD